MATLPQRTNDASSLLVMPSRQRQLSIRFLSALASVLARLGDSFDRSKLLCLAMIGIAYIPFTIMKAYQTPLQSDEVYTLAIAQQPTFDQLIAASRQIDLHPPLHYLIQRAVLTTHIPLLLATRLPSVLAIWFALCLVFVFVSRSMGNLIGLSASTMLYFSPALENAWVNRPYALWLCLLACTAVTWQQVKTAHHRTWWLAALAASAFAMMMDYMAGLLCIFPFVFAECIRGQRSRLDWQTLLALTLPCIGGFLYLSQITSFATNSFAPAYLQWAGTATTMYENFFLQPATVCAACLLLVVLLFYRSRTGQTAHAALLPKIKSADALLLLEANPHQTMAASELIVAVSLLLLPALFAVLAAMHRTQFFPRYGLCGTLGVAILIPWFLVRYVHYARAVAVLLSISLLCGGVQKSIDASFNPFGIWRAFTPIGVPPQHLESLDPHLPIVVASAVGFTEMNTREPASVLTHTFYLYDRASAQRYSGSTIFENESTSATLLHLSSKTAPLLPFLAAHQQFYLIANYEQPDEWLPRRLISNGDKLRYLGKFESTYNDDDLYLVSTSPSCHSAPCR
jgi:hypothetical protein